MNKPVRRYALLIGNTNYCESFFHNLRTPANNTKEIADILLSDTVGYFDDVETLNNENSSIANRKITNLFKNKGKDDLILLYFSGHGLVSDDDGILYLAFPETEKDCPEVTAVSSRFIKERLDNSYSNRIIVILDCCFSGAFNRSRMSGQSVNRLDISKILGDQGYGRIIITATDSTEYAWEDENLTGDLKHSLFSYFLIKGLKTGEADTDGNGFITINRLFSYIHKNVTYLTNKQTPQKFSYKEENDIIIAVNPYHNKIPTNISIRLKDPDPWTRISALLAIEELILNNKKNNSLVDSCMEALKNSLNDSDNRVSGKSQLIINNIESSKEDEVLNHYLSEKNVECHTANFSGIEKELVCIGVINPSDKHIDILSKIVKIEVILPIINGWLCLTNIKSFLDNRNNLFLFMEKSSDLRFILTIGYFNSPEKPAFYDIYSNFCANKLQASGNILICSNAYFYLKDNIHSFNEKIYHPLIVCSLKKSIISTEFGTIESNNIWYSKNNIYLVPEHGEICSMTWSRELKFWYSINGFIYLSELFKNIKAFNLPAMRYVIFSINHIEAIPFIKLLYLFKRMGFRLTLIEEDTFINFKEDNKLSDFNIFSYMGDFTFVKHNNELFFSQSESVVREVKESHRSLNSYKNVIINFEDFLIKFCKNIPLDSRTFEAKAYYGVKLFESYSKLNIDAKQALVKQYTIKWRML